MSKVEIYSKGYCPYCKQAKATLESMGVEYKEYEITNSEALQLEMRERSRRATVPQIFINNQHIGGGDDFHNALRNGELSQYF
jgi:glutaredoxin 3